MTLIDSPPGRLENARSVHDALDESGIFGIFVMIAFLLLFSYIIVSEKQIPAIQFPDEPSGARLLKASAPGANEFIGSHLVEKLAVNPAEVRLPLPERLTREIGSISEAVSRLTDQQPRLLTRGKAKEMAQKNWSCDIARTKIMLDYRPTIDLVQGTEITVDWYRRNNWL